MTTKEQREHWARLEQAATPGEWGIEEGSSFVMVHSLGDLQDCGDYGVLPSWICNCGRCYGGDVSLERVMERVKGNAAFIAAARTAVPALLADVAELEAEVARINARLAHVMRVAGQIVGDEEAHQRMEGL